MQISREVAQYEFEDSFVREYRELSRRLPPAALLGDELLEDEREKTFEAFYHYFDLTNEQAFLNQTGRISSKTWKFWEGGIRSNMARPAFKDAWERVTDTLKRNRATDFQELRELLGEALPTASTQPPRALASGRSEVSPNEDSK